MVTILKIQEKLNSEKMYRSLTIKYLCIVGLGSIAGIAPIETLGGGLDSTDLPGVSDIPIPESTVEQVRLQNVLSLRTREWYDMATLYSKLFPSFSPVFNKILISFLFWIFQQALLELQTLIFPTFRQKWLTYIWHQFVLLLWFCCQVLVR